MNLRECRYQVSIKFLAGGTLSLLSSNSLAESVACIVAQAEVLKQYAQHYDKSGALELGTIDGMRFNLTRQERYRRGLVAILKIEDRFPDRPTELTPEILNSVDPFFQK